MSEIVVILAGILGFGLIILFYFMKEKADEKTISSLLFWKEVYENIEASHKLEKLKKNLLLILQLLIWLLLVLALLNPYWNGRKKENEELILVIDNSASMNSFYGSGKETRLDIAIDEGERLLKNVKEGQKITLVVCNETSNVLVNRSSNQEEIREQLNKVEPTDLKGNVSNSFSVLESITKQMKEYRTIFYTDTDVDISKFPGELMSVAGENENYAIEYMTHSREVDGIKVLVQISNYGTTEKEQTIDLYGGDWNQEEQLIDIQTVSVKPGESKSCYFGPYDFDGAYLKVELEKEDQLLGDNCAYDLMEQTGTQKVLLVSESNVFLEQAIQTIEGIELYKTESADNVKTEDEYDLVIFDGMAPKEIPKEAGILCVGTTIDGIEEEEKKKNQEVVFDHTSIVRYLEGESFVANEVSTYTKPKWAEPLFLCENSVAGFYGQENGRRVAVLGFQLHKTDFPLKPEFPLFIQGIAQYLMESRLISKEQVATGEMVSVEGRLNGGEIKLFYQGNEVALEHSFVPTRAGLYKVTQKVDDDTITNYMNVSFPIEESTIEQAKNYQTKEEGKEMVVLGKRSYRAFFIIGALFLLLVEWLVYIKRQ